MSDLPYDKAQALDQMGGSEDLLREVAGAFLEDYPGQLAEIHRGILESDAEVVRFNAHTIKGSVGTFCAQPAHAAALHLEQQAKDADWIEIEKAARQLEQELSRLSEALKLLITN